MKLPPLPAEKTELIKDKCYSFCGHSMKFRSSFHRNHYVASKQQLYLW